VRDRGEIGMDLLILRRVIGHQIGGRYVAWTAALASASTGQSVGLAPLVRLAAYLFELENVR
jgi:hypothetical protein